MTQFRSKHIAQLDKHNILSNKDSYVETGTDSNNS